MRIVRQLMFTATISAMVPGCIPITEIEFPRVPGHVAEGSCMCSWCLNRPFCRNATTGETLLRNLGDPCPDGFDSSVQTTVVLFRDTRAGILNCIVPEGKDLSFASMSTSCPVREPDRVAIEDVEPCIDVPPCARPAECFGPDDPLPDPPTCPDLTMTGPRRAVCGANPHFESDDPDRFREGLQLAAAEGRQKLVESCGVYGRDFPAGPEAERFCFLSCANPLVDIGDGCSPDLDPEITQQSIVVPIDGATIQVRVRIDDETHVGTTSGSGLVAIEAPDCGPLMSCVARIPWVRLEADAPLSIAGETVRNLRLRNGEPFPDDIEPFILDNTKSVLQIPSGGRIFATGTIDGVGERGIDATLTLGITAFIDWDDRMLSMDPVTFTNDAGNAIIRFAMPAQPIPNLLPRADAGPDRVLECASPTGTPTVLSAAGTTDPDGVADLVAFMWTAGGADARIVGTTRDVSVTLPLGRSHFTVSARDRAGAGDLDETLITVQDTAPPVFEDVELATDCLWSPDHRMHLFRLGREIDPRVVDACSSDTPTVRIVDAFSNQPADGTGDGATAPDVRFGSGAVCLRAERAGGMPDGRGYTVVLEAVDEAGNVGRHELVIDAPHDQRPASRCLTADLAPEVDDDDARCVAEVVTSGSSVGSAGSSTVIPPDAGTASPDPGGCAVSSRGGSTPRVGWLLVVFAMLARRRRR